MRAAARFFREAGISAVGICLIHSYANPAHERRAAAIVREEYPDCTLSLSCDVLPEYREYERAVTTLVDAFIKPHMSRYLDRIRDELGPQLNKKPFLVMQSSGGVASPDQVMRKPITTALSGPAAGALGSAVIAEIAGFPDLVTLDAGGTSTDLCLIEGAKPKITNGGRVGRFPVRIPMLDIKTIGTGGGSIALISREGKLRVGPRSAGAVPGPMCYPNGGDEPTITDANLVLGRLPPALIGGGIKLDVARARSGLQALAARLPGNLSAEQLADGIIEIANWDQANAIRQMTIQRGIDPGRLCAPVVRRLRPGAVGGGDGIDGHEDHHRAAEPRQSVGLRPVGGRLAHRPHGHQGDARGRRSISRRVAAIYASLEAEGTATLEKDGIAPGKIALMREADVRYAGQSMEVRVPAPAGKIDAQFVAGLTDAFHAAHRKTFGYNYAGQQKVEAGEFLRVGLWHDRPAEHSRARPIRRARRNPPAGRSISTANSATRRFSARGSLPAGFKLAGPAIVEEFGSTSVVFPGQELTVDPHGILIIRAAGKSAEARN